MLILHRHFPSDILAGWIVAAMWCLLSLAGLGAAEAAWGSRGAGVHGARRYAFAARRPRLSR
jgi:membrane-associated phospholipid phosphatase